jgi:hypothetical protein
MKIVLGADRAGKPLLDIVWRQRIVPGIRLPRAEPADREVVATIKQSVEFWKPFADVGRVR